MSETTQDHDDPTNSSNPSDDTADTPETGGDTGGDTGGGDQRGVSDEQLPEDLQPTEDNPLARHPGQTGDDEDRIGADSESGDADNPSTNITYGSGGPDSDSDSNSDSGSDSSSDSGLDSGPGSDSGSDSESDSGPADAEEDDGSEALDNGGGGAG